MASRRLLFFLLAASVTAAAGSMLDTPNVKLRVDASVTNDVEISWVPPGKQGGNDDNVLIKIFAENETGEPDVIRTLSYRKNEFRNGESLIETGDWRLEFSGFTAFFQPILRIKILTGKSNAPAQRFQFKGYRTSSKVTVTRLEHEGMGTGDNFKVSDDGTIVVSAP
jgi:hypothetical protein